MNQNLFFRLALYGAVGFAAALMLLAVNIPAVYACGILLIVLSASWFIENEQWQVGKFASSALIVGSLSVYAFYLYVVGDFGLAALTGKHKYSAIYLLLWLLLVRLVQKKSERDWLHLHLLTFVCALLAAGLNPNAQSGVILLAYLFATLCVWLSREMSVSAGRAQDTNLIKPSTSHTLKRRLKANLQPRRLTVISICIALLIVSFAVPIFLTAPRITKSALASGVARGNVVGFTDSINLGSIGRLQQSKRVVMRVRVDNATPATNGRLRWRGTAFDYFNGREWQRSDLSSDEAEAVDDKLFRIGTTRDVKRLVRQTFFVEPTDTPVLFAASRLVAIEGELPFVTVDAEGGAQSSSHLRETLSYRAYSDVEDSPQAVLSSELNTIPGTHVRYLQLPANFDNRIKRLAESVTRNAASQTNYDRARAIEAYLNHEFKYSFEMRAEGQDPLADFLFRVREGHCEYFASAMALMLRAQGIPSRVVVGYQSGEYNQTANAYIVRQREAHAWVEVFFPQTNSWIAFDPTPAWYSPSESDTGNAWLAQLGDYAEAFDLLWAQYVVSYGRQEQRWLAGSLREELSEQRQAFVRRFDALSENLRRSYENLKPTPPETNSFDAKLQGGMILLGVLLIAGLMFLGHRLYQRRRRVTPRSQKVIERTSSSPPPTFEFYERMTATLEACGLRREPQQTPAEFAASLKLPAASVVTNAFERVRYGGENLTADEAAQVEDCLRHIKISCDDEAMFMKQKSGGKI